MLKRRYATAPIIGAVGAAIALSVPAFADADDPLYGSTTALVLGGTGQPTPSTAYVDAVESLYLKPLGFADSASICDMVFSVPCDGSLQVLTTPEVFEFGPSSLQGEADLIAAVEAEYATGAISADHPLTIFAYSQSAILASAAEKVLSATIPSDDLRFVFIGDPSDANGIATNIYADLVQLFGGGTTGTNITDFLLQAINEDQFAPGGLLADYTPNDLYPTTIYDINTDGVADWQEVWDATINNGGSPLEALGNGLYHFFTTHVEYLGLTPEEIATGVATTDGLTTTITIPDGSDPGAIIDDWAALVGAFSHGLADSGGITALLATIQDLFNPAYF
ncbi:PE-PPE domain-containing protein [Mycobacterium paraterrae]|uniref:PE-PPE domain-containing protein n=1 Tax=Mycobacterium paraterrae TaxID=577492 RepID=A0ABY3VRP4_9MYCO|nr:PE-PPE domain-containing protein [Mycobacterium paraterrae]UMB71278.1 PE-PPE domain-containing protein [Mycobacterium paraterrae]